MAYDLLRIQFPGVRPIGIYYPGWSLPKGPPEGFEKVIEKVLACVGATLALYPDSERSKRLVMRGGCAAYATVGIAYYTESHRLMFIAFTGLWVMLLREFYIKATQGDK